jgi:hypothetical protein
MAKHSPPGTPKVGQRVYLGADIRRVADQEDELGRTLVTVHLLVGGVPVTFNWKEPDGEAILTTEGLG